jgi:hypothetical protein
METTLHRQLKQLYLRRGAKAEVPVDRYRIDVVCAGELIEIQHGSLAAIRDKVRALLATHRVRVVKPLVVRKQLVYVAKEGGCVVRRRLSPKRGGPLDLFDELVYFTRVFPHPNLTLETALVEVEECRREGRERRGRGRRRRRKNWRVVDQHLVKMGEVRRFRVAADLLSFVPPTICRPFHTAHLAQALDAPLWMAQRIAYCLRQTGAVREVGRLRNFRLYDVAEESYWARPRQKQSLGKAG